MPTINIGIVAHVDAGKTSLTERILYETHVIDAVGRVDKGTTQTDAMELEKRRGITIKASVVSFFVHDVKINLIDTPGHADFLAEVERSLSVLDGAVLVISAVEGIQAQTRILLTALQKLAIPTIIFINKIDRRGAQSDSLLHRIRDKLTEHILPLNHPAQLGTREAAIIPNDLHNPVFLHACHEQLALHDEQLLAAYVEDEPMTADQVWSALRQQVGAAQIIPVFFGSAITGVGVNEFLTYLAKLFPSQSNLEDKPLSGVVFKLEKETSGEKIAYVRIFAGSLQARSQVPVLRRTADGVRETYTGKVQKLHLFREGTTEQVPVVAAGEFCKVWGLKQVKIGDVIGQWSSQIKTLRFAIPQLETRIEAVPAEQNHQLYQVLQELAEEDPLISVIKDDLHQIISMRIFGEVQKEVIESLLLEQHGLAVRFSQTTIVCIEKPIGIGQAVEIMGENDNPFVATIGFRVEPGPPGSGVSYICTLGALPLSYYHAIEETLYATLAQGLYGWEVTDIIITLTHMGFDRQAGSTAGDFRNLTPLVLMDALSQAGCAVYEPINQFELSIPADVLSTAMFKLSALGAVVEQPILQGDSFLLTGTIPVETTEEFRRELPAFSEGDGVFLTQPSGYRHKEGEYPTRKRMDYNPLHREEYLLHVHHVR